MYTVYVLKSKVAHKSYVGYTDNINRRLGEHNSGRSTFTSKFSPWELIYEERYNNENDAIKREKYLKSCAGRKLLKRVFEK